MRAVLVTLTALLVIGLAVTAGLFWRDLSNVRAAEEAVSKRYALAIDALSEIQDSLTTIAVGDSLRPLAGSLATEQGLTRPAQTEALDRIAEIRGSIVRSKERINRLESDLKKRRIKVAGLEKMIAGLRRSVAEKEQAIAALTGTVDSLNVHVAGLVVEVASGRDTIRARDEAIEERRRELATVRYIIGGRRSLAEAGAVVARGGFLGIGRTLQPASDLDEAQLLPLDTDQQSVLTMPGSRARVLTAQPASSYELRIVEGHVELHILRPREFRKVRQLVILTA